MKTVQKYLALRTLKLLQRKIYGLRAFVPGLRERHRLEAMVGPLGVWNKLQKYQLNVLKTNGLKPGHTLLDLGCGPLQGGIAFIKYLDTGNYIGLDNNNNVIETAKEQIIKNKLTAKKPFIVLSETFGLEELNGLTFDYIWASQNLYYFDEDKLKMLMQMILLKMKDNGKFLGDIIGPKHYAFRLKEPPYILHSVEDIKNIAKGYNLKVKELGEIKEFGYPKIISLSTNVLLEITKIS